MKPESRCWPSPTGELIMTSSSPEIEKIRVLLIGDVFWYPDVYFGIRSSIKTYLENFMSAIDLMEAETGEKGIAQANTFNPHVVFIASDPPDMGVTALVQRLRSANTNVKIVTMSMSNNPQWIIATIEAGADDYASLPVPVHGDNFYKLIQNLYDGTRITLRREWLERKTGNQTS
jgi:DNA-binding NarL/FixJ family response regulator